MLDNELSMLVFNWNIGIGVQYWAAIFQGSNITSSAMSKRLDSRPKTAERFQKESSIHCNPWSFSGFHWASWDFIWQGEKEMSSTALGESKSPRKLECYHKGIKELFFLPMEKRRKKKKKNLSLDTTWDTLMRKIKVIDIIWKNGWKGLSWARSKPFTK